MELTKHTHSTVVLTKDDSTLVIDPGAYTPNSAELVAGPTAVLITHDHPDHFDAAVHADLPLMTNVAYLIDGTVYHPGDSYVVPDVAVQTLLVPASGPWTNLGEGIDFVRAAKPSRSIRIHDLTLSEGEGASFAQFIGDLTGVPLTSLEVGESITV